MSKTKQKIDKLIKFINKSDMDEFLKYRFNDFCEDILFDEWKLVSPYYSEMEFEYMFEKVTNSKLFIPPDENPEDYEEPEAYVDSLEFKNAFITFGLFIFKSYILLCLKSFAMTHKGMNGFVEMIEENIFKREYTDRILSFFSYYKREHNSDMEDKYVSETKEKFNLLDKMSEMNFVYDFASNTGDLDGTIAFVKDSYLCYLESLHLCFCHLSNDLDSILFKESFLIKAKN
jgi:hypothetical protein